MILWFYFSWDAARAFFPLAGNELCQVAKFNRVANPFISTLMRRNGVQLGTTLLTREYVQLEKLEAQLANTPFNENDRSQLADIIEELRATMASYADPASLDPTIVVAFNDIAERLLQRADAMLSEGYSGPADPEAIAKAQAQPRWGKSHIELPPLPLTERGRKLDAASIALEVIGKDFARIRNNRSKITLRLKNLKSRYKGFSISPDDGARVFSKRKEMLKQIDRIFKRIDNGRIFPPGALDVTASALTIVLESQKHLAGNLDYIDRFALPGGRILAGNNLCSEQGSGRWLPKPSDTLRTFLKMAKPSEGFKNIPLLWYKMKPVSEMVDVVLPNWIASLVPGPYPGHDKLGQVQSNFKGSVRDIAVGDFDSFSIPIRAGHIWDSIVRVLAGLFLGVALGVPLGLFMGLSRFFKGFFDPLIELYHPFLR